MTLSNLNKLFQCKYNWIIRHVIEQLIKCEACFSNKALEHGTHRVIYDAEKGSYELMKLHSVI